MPSKHAVLKHSVSLSSFMIWLITFNSANIKVIQKAFYKFKTSD